MYGQPVGRQHAETRAEVERQPVVTGEVHAAYACQDIETTVHGGVATEKDLARQEVVAQREAVIREASLISGQQFDLATEVLEARPAGSGLPQVGAEKEIFCHMVGEHSGIGGIGAEILDRQETEARADFPVLVVDPGCLYLATGHVRFDDARRRAVRILGGFFGSSLLFGLLLLNLFVAAEQRAAARQQCYAERRC